MIVRTAPSLLIAALWAVPGGTQSVDAWITGRIADARTGAAIADAVIVARGGPGGQRFESRSGSRGWYALTGLPPGQYQVRISARGFQAAEVAGLTAGVSARLEWSVRLIRVEDLWLNPQLSRPQAADSLLRLFGPDLEEAKAAQILSPDEGNASSDPSLSFAADPPAVAVIPLNGRDAYALLTTMPGFSADAATALGLGLAASGQRPSSANYLLDGVEHNQPFLSGPRAPIPPEFLEEYRVSTNGFSAEFGRSGGFLANAITRAGGQAWHGLGYANLQDETLNANTLDRNQRGLPRLPAGSAQLGLTAGGPLGGDWALSLAADRLQSQAEGPEREVVLPSNRFTIFADPASLAAQLLRDYPAAAQPDSPGPLGRAVLRPPVTLKRSTGLLRLDRRRGGSAWFARLALVALQQPHRFWTPYPDFVSGLEQPSGSLALRNERRHSAGWQSETRVGWAQNRTAWSRARPEVPALAEALSNALLPGSPLFYAFEDQSASLELGHLATVAREGHLVRTGFSFWRQRSSGALTAGRDPQFIFENIQDFILDRPSLLRAALDRRELPRFLSPDYERLWIQHPFALFLQDTWRLGRRWTANLGLRYESLGAPVTRNDLLLALGDGSSLSAQLTRARLAEVNRQPLWRADRTGLQARLGLAFSPMASGRVVLRTGYGLFADPLFGNLWQGVRNNGWSLATLAPPLPPGYNYLRPLAEQLPSLEGQRFDDSFPPATLIDPRLRSPQVQSYFAGAQWKPSPGWTLEVHGTGSAGRRLAVTDILNRQRADNASLPEIAWRTALGVSDYWSLQTVLRWRHRGGFLQAAHTWSHSLDNQSDPLEGEFFDLRFTQPGVTPTPRPRARFSVPLDPRADRGSSDFDQRHSLVVLSAWRWRGFELAQLAGFRTGLPYSVTAGGERADLIGAPRLNREIPGGRLLLDQRAFTPPPLGRPGNTGRNSFRGPGLYSLDLSLSRAFPFGEARRLVLRLDAYNALNHTNLNNPQAELLAPDFGQAAFGRRGRDTGFPAAAPFEERPRTLQIIARWEF